MVGEKIKVGNIIKLNSITSVFNYSVELKDGKIINAHSKRKIELGEEVKIESFFYFYWIFRIV